MASYRELLVWQKAMEMVEQVYHFVDVLPSDERFELSRQLRRAAVSVPSNVAEGHSRKSTREYLQFLSIALGSVAELETQLLLAVRLKMAKPEDTAQIEENLSEIGKMLRAIQSSISARVGEIEQLSYAVAEMHPDP
ncbi:MAG: four helix bundle protein [Wenzhouxiangella sp.]